ncbi:MAG: PaaI family thioesterase [Polyangiaceae bacterium]
MTTPKHEGGHSHDHSHAHGHDKHAHGHAHSHAHAEEIALDPNTFGTDQPCFGCSPTHPIGFRLQVFRRGDEVVTRFLPGDNHQGPPGVMHGGLVTTLADEIAAWAIIALKGRFGFTVSLEARLMKAVRVGVEIEATGRIDSETPRFTKVAVELKQQGKTCVKGLFTFAILDEAAAEKVIGGPLPEAWKRFAK